jgi:polyphosphate kinase 2 (PPK2 family)
VLVVRVHGLVEEEVWAGRYEHINAFEASLADAGTTIVKLFLHISQEEQHERFEERRQRPDKRWKYNPKDLEERARWPEYMAAYEEAITRTSTERAPWFVVPADRKWFRNWAVSRIVLEALEAIDPRYPEAPRDGG